VTRVVLLAVLLLLAARAFWMLVGGIIRGAAGVPGPRREAPPVRLVRDPVCGTWVPPRAALSMTSGGTTLYFCSEECRRSYAVRRSPVA
jgi:YHS domain-containing protein